MVQKYNLVVLGYKTFDFDFLNCYCQCSFQPFIGHFPKLSLKPELQLQLWAELVLSLSYPATQGPP